MPPYEIFRLTEIDPATRHAYEEFQKDFVAFKSTSMIEGNASAAVIDQFHKFERNHDNLTDTWRYGITFLGYRLAKQNVSDHELGETLAVQYRRSIKFKGDGNWNTWDNPFDSFMDGYLSAHPLEQRRGKIEHSIRVLREVLGEPELLKVNYLFIPEEGILPRFVKELLENREKWI